MAKSHDPYILVSTLELKCVFLAMLSLTLFNKNGSKKNQTYLLRSYLQCELNCHVVLWIQLYISLVLFCTVSFFFDICNWKVLDSCCIRMRYLYFRFLLFTFCPKNFLTPWHWCIDLKYYLVLKWRKKGLRNEMWCNYLRFF